MPAVLTFSSPRAWAFSVLGLQAYLDWFPGDRAIQGVRNTLANRLLDIYERSRTETWRWFEKSLSYSNARLPQALILAGWRSNNHRMIEAGMDSLKWLVAEQHRDDQEIFVPIGSSGFFVEGEKKARFDQQPVEACATVSACLEVYRLTEESQWLEEARRVFRWFLGKNDLQAPLYDPVTGGCRDGLHPDRVNENEGAESTLSFLMALLEMQAAQRSKRRSTASGNECHLLNPIISPAESPESIALEQAKVQACVDQPLFTRYSGNPILSRKNWPYPINSVFNAGAVALPDGDTLLLCRVEDRTGLSHLCAARSANGIDEWRIDPQPTLMANPRGISGRNLGNRRSAHHPCARARSIRNRLHFLCARRTRSVTGAHQGLSKLSSDLA